MDFKTFFFNQNLVPLTKTSQIKFSKKNVDPGLLLNLKIPELPTLLNKIPAKLDGATDIQSHK